MISQGNSVDSVRSDLKRLTEHGLIGFYDYLEVTELVGFGPKSKSGQKGLPVNLFSIVSAEEGQKPNIGRDIQWLNNKRIKISELTNWEFGLARYYISNFDLDNALLDFSKTGQWRLSGEQIKVGSLRGRKVCFVPPDATQELAWNRLLKNNFWNGSYIIELTDADKENIPDFWKVPAALQSLSEAVADYIPLGVASLPDRLGNIIIQLPVTIALAAFKMDKTGQMQVDLTWHPKATPRPLRASCQIYHDDLLLEFGSVTILDRAVPLGVGRSPHPHRGLVWDEQSNLIIAATAASQFIHAMKLNTRIIAGNGGNTERTFLHDGIPNRIPIMAKPSESSVVGTPVLDDMAQWTERRLYRDETKRLKEQRRFVAYGPHIDKNKQSEHQRALVDLRALLRDYGRYGSWLWDPYLDATDVLKTLFHNPHPHADLRALSGCANIQKNNMKWIKEQRNKINKSKGNTKSLNLIFRARTDHLGWDFHDRFLIFPSRDCAPHAWSLGTSINSLGYRHHILMAVPDAQLIMDAFLELWNKLDKPQHEVWSI